MLERPKVGGDRGLGGGTGPQDGEVGAYGVRLAAGKPPLAESRSMHAFPAAQRPLSPPRDNAAHPHLPRHASMHNFPTAHGGGRPPSPPRDAFAGHPLRHASHAQLKRVPTSPELSL